MDLVRRSKRGEWEDIANALLGMRSELAGFPLTVQLLRRGRNRHGSGLVVRFAGTEEV